MAGTAKKVILSLLLATALTVHAGEKITVPVNNCHVNQVDITQNELYGIFTLSYRYWGDGTKIKVVLLKDTLLHREFLWDYLGISVARYREIIESRYSSGRTNRPIVVEDELHMIKTVSKIDGSVGYLGQGRFLISKGDNVKILNILF